MSRIRDSCADDEPLMMLLMSKLTTIMFVMTLSASYPVATRRHRNHKKATRSPAIVHERHTQEPHYTPNPDDVARSHRSLASYDHLCPTVPRNVRLNTPTHEYNPPFYTELLCAHTASGDSSRVQRCAFNFLHCVQTYSTLHFSWRRAGIGQWEPSSMPVASGCECMWPTDELGPMPHSEL